MKLSSMKFKGIRCAFYCLDSKAKVTYKQDKIDKMVKDGEDCVLMYNPTSEQRQTILSKLEEQSGNLTMNGLSVLECIKLLTNIELDVTDEEALELINNPDEMLELIALECNVITLDLVKKQIKELDAIASLPDSIKNPLLNEAQAKFKEEEEKAKIKKQEADELKEQMKALEEKLKLIEG
mgnify:FL=1|nr:MAG TPA: hypothetical protein [Caudoviricetes sp.]